MSNRKISSLIPAAALLAALPAQGQEPQPEGAPQARANALAEAQARASADAVLEDALQALDETGRALEALTGGNPEEAAAALETAIGKLEAVLERNPGLALAPVDVATAVHDIAASPADIRRARVRAMQLLEDNQLQLARPIISGLASEIVITTTYIPLGTYPLALKSAAALIRDDSPDTAAQVLANALGTLVVIDSVLPLPLLNARTLIDEARTLSEKAARSDAENARLSALLAAIEAQIARGEALEYGGRGAFDPLKAEMKEIRRRTADGGSGTGIFDRLSELFEQIGREHADATD